MFNLTLTGFLDWLWAIIFSPTMAALLALGLFGGCVKTNATIEEQAAGVERAMVYIAEAARIAKEHGLTYQADIRVSGRPGVGQELEFFLNTGVAVDISFSGNAAGGGP